MTDVETPPNDRTETVSRVLAALSSGTSDGALDRGALREVLASEGRSLPDLPEVGLWLALTEVALTPVLDLGAESVTIDLRERPRVDEARLEQALRESTILQVNATVEATEPERDAIEVDAIEVGVVEEETVEVGVVEEETVEADVIGPGPIPMGPVRTTDVEAPGQPVVEPADDVVTDAPPPPTKRRGRLRGRRQRLPKIVTLDDPRPALPSSWVAPIPTPASPAGPSPSAPGPAAPESSTSTPSTDAPPVGSPAPAAPESGRLGAMWPLGLASRLHRLDDHLRAALADPIGVHLPDPATSAGAIVERPAVDPFATLAAVGSLRDHLTTVLDRPVAVRLPDAARVGTARPDPYWPPALVHRLTALSEHLRGSISLGQIPGPDPTVPNGASLDAYWPPSLVRRLDALSTFLDSRFGLPTAARAPASRLAGASNGAEPDPYWPRHLVRPGAPTAPPAGRLAEPPRSSDELESDLQDALDGVALIGEADLEPFAAETEISLARLVRRVPLDRLGRIYPATLASFLVRQTALHPNPTDFDENVPISALRRTNPVGLAFSEALVRLSKPVFREVEQRDEFDHRVRYLRRMQLHGGLAADVVPSVVAEVLASHWTGARSGREVAQDWLLARRAVGAAIGDPALRLLTRTDHGAMMLEALLDLVRRRWLDPEPGEPPAGLDPLPRSLVDQAWSHLLTLDEPAGAWGESPRPRLRLGTAPGDGPELELPRSSARWHLNGELLGYGSPVHRKTVPLPTARGGKWAMTTGTARRASPLDIGLQSAADDRTVLVFDELGRYHHHSLPLGGTRATVVAPSGTRVDGGGERSLLIGRWIGHERIEVDLTDLPEMTVSERGRAPVVIEMDRRLGATTLAADQPRVAFRGHVPPPGEVEVVIADGTARQSSILSDLWIDDDHGTYGLGHLVTDGPARTVTLTVARAGFEPVVCDLPVAGRETEDVAPGGVRGALAAFGTEVTVDSPIALWRTDPLLAAATDDWTATPTAAGRWAMATGWAPPIPGAPADAALRRLFRPLVDTLRGAADEPADHRPVPLTTAAAWAIGLGDAEALDDWLARHRRPLWRWRATLPPLRHLDPLWDRFHRTDRGRVALPVLAAGLLSVIDGPHRAAAGDRLAEAVGLAPRLAVPALVTAVGYARVQLAHPESRFQDLGLGRE